MAEKKLNVFDVLKRADKQDFGWYESLSDDQKKEFSPWLIQRWIASRKLELVNEITNPLVGNISKELAWKLFCAIGMSGIGKYAWTAPPKKITSGSHNKITELVAKHYGVSKRVAGKYYIPDLSHDDVLEIAELHAKDDKDIKEIKKILKNGKAK